MERTPKHFDLAEERPVISSSAFWDALAPFHADIEDNYLDRKSIRRVLREIQGPVLVVGAGQGLIVAELKKHGFACDGVDSSPEMVRFAASRRGLNLVQADARAMPFAAGTYETIVYATGVIDFMADEEAVRVILQDGHRVLRQTGKIFVAFYRISPPLVNLLEKLGLLRNSMLWQRQMLEIYLMRPFETFAWVAQRAGVGRLQAVGLLLRSWLLSTLQEKKAGFSMQRALGRASNARLLIEAAPEKQPYRDEPEIRGLFDRLGIRMKKFQTFESCYMVQV